MKTIPEGVYQFIITLSRAPKNILDVLRAILSDDHKPKQGKNTGKKNTA